MRNVTRNALIKRINRTLTDGSKLRVTRGERMQEDVGEVHAFDYSQNIVTDVNIDVEAMARKLGVLGYNETMEDA